MNNKWLQSGIAVLLWGFLAKNVIDNRSPLGNLFNYIANRFLPEQIMGMSGTMFLFSIVTIIYAMAVWAAFFYVKRPFDE